MPFQLSRGRLMLLTGTTLVAFLLGLACVGAVWPTNDVRWGHTGLGILAVALGLNQRRLAGQNQRRTNEVIQMYAGRPAPAAPLAAVPAPREAPDAAEGQGRPAGVEGDPGQADTP